MVPVRPAPNAFGAVHFSEVKTSLAAQTWRSMFLAAIAMEKPSSSGPSPGRKARHVLGSRLNRKTKRPPPLPLKKKAPVPDRTTSR